MTSLRSRLLALWLLLLASAAATGFLLFASYRQSAAVHVVEAEAAVARACRELVDRFAFFSSGMTWSGSAGIDESLRREFAMVAQTALARATGIEGGFRQASVGSLAYAFPIWRVRLNSDWERLDASYSALEGEPDKS